MVLCHGFSISAPSSRLMVAEIFTKVMKKNLVVQCGSRNQDSLFALSPNDGPTDRAIEEKTSEVASYRSSNCKQGVS